MEKQVLPGTMLPYAEEGGSAFRPIRKMLLQAGGFSLSQLCSLTGLEGTTIQNWVKRGWVPKLRIGKRYDERQTARILLIASLRGGLQIEQIAALADSVNLPQGGGSPEQENEPLLYDCFVRTVFRLSMEEGLTGQKIAQAVQTALRGCGEPVPGFEGRAAQVLAVMAEAYFAAQLQRRAEADCRALVSGFF
ncbi:MAG: DUF1836 domain-containing protein [Firmicutes bacterium]|nr:DUF1836 domain-containing protein [Bacillota bacterium]